MAAQHIFPFAMISDLHFVYLLFIACNYYLTRQIYRLYFLYMNRKSKKVILSLVQMTTRNFIKQTVLISIFTTVLAVTSVYLRQFSSYIFSFCVTLLYQFIQKRTHSENITMTDIKKLSLGYGAALWYYKNYLDRFLDNNLSSRINLFISEHGVKLPVKLYILCPSTCKVQKYIDDTDIIDRCRELVTWKDDNSGIFNREYNITVYRIEHPSHTFRCAIEYAQPLKSLFRFKEMGRITPCEMRFQRAEFIKQLNKFLQEDKSASNLCELVEFDDETEEIHNVLYKTESILKFIKENSVS